MWRVFKVCHFNRWMHKTQLSVHALCDAVLRTDQGLIDFFEGKKRVRLPRRSKSGSTRTLVAPDKPNPWFFVFGSQKYERANVSANELEKLRAIAASLLGFVAKELDALLQREALQEMCSACQDQNN